MVPVTLFPHHLFSASFSTGTEVAGTHMASSSSHAIRNQCVYRSYEYFIDNIDEIVFAILKYDCLDAIQKLFIMT